MITMTHMLSEIGAVPLKSSASDHHRQQSFDHTNNVLSGSSKNLVISARRHVGCRKRLIKRTNMNLEHCTPEKVEQLFPGTDLPWQNPCSASAYSDNANIVKKHLNLTPLKLHLKSMLRTKYGSCNSSDNSSTSWCHETPRYSFFEHSRKSEKLCLRLEHKRLQVYVAGISYLNQFNENDKRHNLKRILQDAKTLLCEIETAINQTECIKAPSPLKPREMCMRLNLHSIINEDDTEVDVIFAKANFGKYLRGLNRTISVHRLTPACAKPKPIGIRKHQPTSSLDFPAVMYGSELKASKTNNRLNQPKTNRRRNNRKQMGELPTTGKNRSQHQRQKGATIN